MTCDGGTTVVFIGSGDGVRGGDPGNASTRRSFNKICNRRYFHCRHHRVPLPFLGAFPPGAGLGVVRLGVKEVVTPEGPACTIVEGGDETGMGEEPTPTPNGEVVVVVVVPNMFCNVLSGEKLTSSFTS